MLNSRSSLVIVSLVACVAVATGCNAPQQDTPAATATSPETESAQQVEETLIDIDDPTACAPCHGAIVEEWSISQHAHAHHSNDPLYAGILEMRSERQGRDLTPHCASCHHPRAQEDTDGAIAQQGVSCATCHAVEEVVQGSGHEALRFSGEDRLRGPHDVTGEGSPLHLNGPAAPHLVDGQTLCLACHGEHSNPQGAPTCTTGAEHEQLANGESCTGCHMPLVNHRSGVVSPHLTHRSHTFIAGHGSRRSGNEDWMMGTLELEGSLGDEMLNLEVTNTSGHSSPTGFPGRRLTFSLVGSDASGAEIWHSADIDNPEVARTLEFARYYGNDAGEPAMPAFATQILRDTRLSPNEVRSISVPLPAEVVEVDVRVNFHFAPRPMLERQSLQEDPHFAPLTVAHVRIASDEAAQD